MAYNVEKLSTIDLGRQGENLARTIEIDVSSLLAQWPDAVISLLCKRKHDTNPYIAVTEVRDGILIWPITSVETETAGDGKIELRAVCGEVIAKSMTAVIRVTASLTGSETEAPDAAQGWVDQVLAAGNTAEESAKAAQDAATRAENAASNLDTAVDDAEASARAAGEQADLAGDHASAAGLSATEAGEDAQRAEQAATSAEESAVSAQNSASEADLSKQGADASAQAALAEYNKAAEKAEAAQVSVALAEQSASNAEKSKTAAEQGASAATSSETNAAKSAEAAAKSASDASASKDAAAGSASAARSSEENAAQSAEDAAASATAAEKSKEEIDEALASAAESAKAAGQSAENSEASAARSEAAAQVALTIIDDKNVGTEKTWSSQNLLDRLTVPFEKKGAIVQCYPVEDSPLSVVASIEPVQHFDWMSKSATSSQVTTTGKNLWANGDVSFTKNATVDLLVPILAGEYTISCVFDNDSTEYNDAVIFYFYDGASAASGNFSVIKGQSSKIITFAQDVVKLSFYATNSGATNEGVSATYTNIQIEAGSTATTYEPYTGGKASPSPEYPQKIVDSIPAGSYYVPSTAPAGGYWKITLDEALGGVKDHSDVLEIDSFTGRYRIVRNSARVELNTDTVFLKQGVGDNAYFVTALAPEATEAYQLSSFCSHFPVINLLGGNTLQGNGGWKTSLYIRWGERFDTADELNAYVAEQFNAGTPITVRYARAEAEVITGQAEHTTYNTDLTALGAAYMGLTAPDPDHPCEITVVDSIAMQRCGRNILNPRTYGTFKNSTVYSQNGIVATIREDNSIHIQGTAKASTYLNFFEGTKGLDIRALQGKTVVASTSGEARIVIGWFFSGGSRGENGASGPVTIPSTATTLRAYIPLATGMTYDTICYPQIELGTIQTAYEPYTGDTYTVDLPADFAGGTLETSNGSVFNAWKRFNLAVADMNNSDNYPGWAVTDDSLSEIFGVDMNTNFSVMGNVSNIVGVNTMSVNPRDVLWLNKDTVFGGMTQTEIKEAYPELVFTCYIPLPVSTESSVIPQPILALPGLNSVITDASSMTVSGHSDPIRIIADLTERVAALEDAAAGGTT